jgi:hypothetical protein
MTPVRMFQAIPNPHSVRRQITHHPAFADLSQSAVRIWYELWFGATPDDSLRNALHLNRLTFAVAVDELRKSQLLSDDGQLCNPW